MPDYEAINSMPVEIIMNTVLDGLIIIDELGLIQSFNLAAERIFNYSPDEVIGNNVKMLMPCLLYTSPSPRDKRQSRMPSSA